MSTQTAEKIYKEVKALRQETKTLKELVFLVLKDREGEYKDSFVKKILKKSRSKPQFIFTNKKDFLNQIS
ncbi:hypothetical protein JW698_01445 [Candidatus Wolfebacteria bacterium]|nr:hypothetical protein [Candidatus Wolfebacteria bacterium]